MNILEYDYVAPIGRSQIIGSFFRNAINGRVFSVLKLRSQIMVSRSYKSFYMHLTGPGQHTASYALYNIGTCLNASKHC